MSASSFGEGTISSEEVISSEQSLAERTQVLSSQGGGEATVDLDEGAPSPRQTEEQTCQLTPGEQATVGGTVVGAASELPSDHTAAWDSQDDRGPVAPLIRTAVAKAQDAGATRIPGYEILSELGRGAMGVVYKARQSGLNRLVALKMILAGAHATSKDIMRFQIEAEAVARVKHPYIVQVFEIGDSKGCPFFSLEYVEGGTLADLILQKKLTSSDAARIVEQLAQAMDCAHRSGVIHRDLKPANVLIATRGPWSVVREQKVGSASRTTDHGPRDTITPKITDFGLAKHLGEDSSKTRAGSIMGTPSYMAPEQAEGRIAEVGPPADIYALGAILYDCLTGRPPFQGTTILETLDQVRKVEPLPVRNLQPGVPRDLETICLKCLAKDPRRRYHFAGDLAEDLRRFQAGEPITARRVSTLERTVKWCKRRPAAAALVGLIAVGILGGLVGGFAYADHERRSKERETALREVAEEKRKKAEVNFKKATAAVDFMLTRIGQERLQYEPRMEQVRRDLLEQALRFYDEFLNERGDDPAIRYETVRSLRKVGDIRRLLGVHGEAGEAYQSALDLLDGLIGDNSEAGDYRRGRAEALNELGTLQAETGKRREAESTYRQARDELQLLVDRENRPSDRRELAITCYNRARTLLVLGRGEEAEQQLKQAVTLQEKLMAEHDSDLTYRRDLAQSLSVRGELLTGVGVPERIAALKQSLKLFMEVWGRTKQGGTIPSDRQAVALLHHRLGNILEPSQPKVAEVHYRDAILIGTGLMDDFPTVPEYRRDTGSSYINLGILLLSLGEAPEAEKNLKIGLAIKEKLVTDYPRIPDYRIELSSSLNNHALRLLTAGRLPEAEAAYTRSVQVQNGLSLDVREEPGSVREHARTLTNLANVQQLLQHNDEADANFRKAIGLCEGLTARFKDSPGDEFELARARYLLATLLQIKGDLKAAEPLHQSAREKLKRLGETHPMEPDYRHVYAQCLNNLGDLLRATNRADLGLALWVEAAGVLAKLARDYSDRPVYIQEQARTLHNHGVVLGALNRLDDAETSHGAARVLRQKLVAKREKEPVYRLELASSEEALATVLARLNRRREAEAGFREAIRLTQALSKEFGDQPEYLRAELKQQTNLGAYLKALGDVVKQRECEKRIDELKIKLEKTTPSKPTSLPSRLY